MVWLQLNETITWVKEEVGKRSFAASVKIRVTQRLTAGPTASSHVWKYFSY